MTLLNQHDFDTETGRKKIINTINSLESKVHELAHVVHECLKKERRLENEMAGYDEIISRY